MIHFPFDRDTRLDLVLWERERAFEEGALRALATQSDLRPAYAPPRASLSGIAHALLTRFRRGPFPQVPVQIERTNDAPSRDVYPANVVPMGRKMAVSTVLTAEDTEPCACGCAGGA
jgi:hypothetical protein